MYGTECTERSVQTNDIHTQAQGPKCQRDMTATPRGAIPKLPCRPGSFNVRCRAYREVIMNQYKKVPLYDSDSFILYGSEVQKKKRRLSPGNTGGLNVHLSTFQRSSGATHVHRLHVLHLGFTPLCINVYTRMRFSVSSCTQMHTLPCKALFAA